MTRKELEFWTWAFTDLAIDLAPFICVVATLFIVSVL
jgi:hypothetical protein